MDLMDCRNPVPGCKIDDRLSMHEHKSRRRHQYTLVVILPHAAESGSEFLRSAHDEQMKFYAEGPSRESGLLIIPSAHLGNITGSQILSDELTAKRLELLKALVPTLSKVAFLQEDVTLSAVPQMRARYDQQAALAARTLGVELHLFIVRRSEELAAAFRGMRKNHDQGVLVAPSAFMFVHRQAIVDLAAAHRIPAIYEIHYFVELGGLMSYGVNTAEMERRAAVYVDRILRGAKPADLPVEQPTKFDFVINLKTAKVLRLTIPQSLLVRADQVIE